MRLKATPEEKLAFRIVGRELDVDVDATLEQRAPGQVDAVLHYRADPSRSAALEVTALVDQVRVETWAALNKRNYRLREPKLNWWWMVTVPPTVRLRELEQHLPQALQIFEQHGMTRPRPSLVGPPSESADLRWYARNQIHADGHTDIVTDGSSKFRQAGTVTVLPRPEGGFAGNIEALPKWITDVVQTNTQVRSKVKKLQRTGLAEQHLFLLVDLGGVPYPVFDALASGKNVPATAPELGSITHLWLFPSYAFSSTLLVWTRDGAWKRAAISAG